MVSYMHVVYLTPNFLQVLILVVVDNGLVRRLRKCKRKAGSTVLILIAVDNGLVLCKVECIKQIVQQS